MNYARGAIEMIVNRDTIVGMMNSVARPIKQTSGLQSVEEGFHNKFRTA